MQDNHSLLALMLQDQRGQRGVHRPGPYWESYAARVEAAVREYGLSGFRGNSAIGKGYADALRTDPRYLVDGSSLKGRLYRRLLKARWAQRFLFGPYNKLIEHQTSRAKTFQDLYVNQLLGDWFAGFREAHRIPDTRIADPSDTVTLGGQVIGRSYLKSFLAVHNFSRSVDFERPGVVLEIGGGFGATCHTLLEMFPNIRKYVYLDIPPVLYVGTQYLRQIFGDSVRDYGQTRDASSLAFRDDKSMEILAIAPWQLERVEADVDLFWNSASMQEMQPKMVTHYSSEVGRLLVGGESKACLYIYSSGKAERTIQEDELVELVERNAGLRCTRLDGTLDISSGSYVIGGRGQ